MILAILGEGGAENDTATHLRGLGAKVTEFSVFAAPAEVAAMPELPAVLVFEVGGRIDVATRALSQLRQESVLLDIPSLAVVPERHASQVAPSAPFDDFIVAPYFAAELYARIRRLEWRASSFSSDETMKLGSLVVDRAAATVTAQGREVSCTRMEWKLLVFLLEKRGKMLTREHILRRVWGSTYDGGPRTVDIHVRRLRAKLGDALPIETVRGGGYKLRT